jgi:hypothetical protein
LARRLEYLANIRNFGVDQLFFLKKDSAVWNCLTRTKILQPISSFNVKNKMK